MPFLAGLGAAFLFIILSLLLFVMVYGDKPYEERVAEKTLTKILRAVSEQDPQALKEMFSPAALEQAPELDANIEKLIALLQGEILSKEEHGLVVEELLVFMKGNRKITAGYILVTEPGIPIKIMLSIRPTPDTSFLRPAQTSAGGT